MKIGIITLPLGQNHGGILQNYALQRALLKLGHQPRTINIPFPEFRWKKWRQVFFRKVDKAIRGCDFSARPKNWTPETLQIRTKNLREFVENRLFKTKSLSLPICESDLSDYNFAAYIVGSDQIWHPSFTYRQFIAASFLDFLPITSSAIRLAYAASFGHARWSPARKFLYRHILARYAKRFHAVSVREDSGIELCRNLLNIQAEQILDPVFLLTEEDYVGDLNLQRNIAQSPYLFSYILDPTAAKQDLINTVCQNNALHEIKIGGLGKPPIENAEVIPLPGIETWLESFLNADFVITDSFHGTVIAILFKKNFLCFPNQQRGIERFLSLLKMVELEQHLLPNDLNQTSAKQLQLPPIKYDKVQKTINKQREISLQFLKQHLPES